MKLYQFKSLREDRQTELVSPVNTVYHHPNAHDSKKWKDYLIEFFMLFLAVTFFNWQLLKSGYVTLPSDVIPAE